MNDGKKKKPQKHQNKTAFKIVFDPQALDKHKKVSFKDLCKRCADQLSWKLQYNKYKKMTQPAKCLICTQKNVLRSYMKACEGCTAEKQICPKCLQTEAEQQTELKKNELQKKQQAKQSEHRMTEFMKTLKERSRRTVRRGVQKGTVSWDKQLNTFVDEEGVELVGLHFRKAFAEELQSDEDQELHSSDDQIERQNNQEETQVKQKKKNGKKAQIQKQLAHSQDESDEKIDNKQSQEFDNDFHDDQNAQIKQPKEDFESDDGRQNQPNQQADWSDADDGFQQDKQK